MNIQVKCLIVMGIISGLEMIPFHHQAANASVITDVKAQTANTLSTFDMKDFSCKELMLSGTENRELMMSLFHGFMNGKK